MTTRESISEQPISAEWLVIARQSRGLTQKELAQRLDVTQGWLSRVESGLRGISTEQLKTIADALGYPTDFFTQNEPPYFRGDWVILPRKRQDISGKTLESIHAKLLINKRAIERLIRGVDIEPCRITKIDIEEFNGSVEDIARMVRRDLGHPRGPIPNLTDFIESLGGIVIPFDFGTRKIDAMSLWPNRMPPLFFINTTTPGDRLRFTLCHEFGHIVMHQSVMREDIEREADKFAAEFLMPAKEIKPYLSNLTLPKLAAMKLQWKVSMAALLKRASDLHTITPSQSKMLWMQMSRQGYRLREPEETNIPIEAPTLYREIVEVYRHEMKYSPEELSKVALLTEQEVRKTFIDPPQFEASRDAVDEATDIINKAKRDREL